MMRPNETGNAQTLRNVSADLSGIAALKTQLNTQIKTQIKTQLKRSTCPIDKHSAAP